MIANEDDAKLWLRSECGASQQTMLRLQRFVEMLEAENQEQNLVSATSLGQVWTRHICDSAQLLRYVPRGTQTWLDLGTGAGFPGIVIALLSEQICVTMVESRSRRIAWLSELLSVLSLTNAVVEGRRVEQVSTRPFDVISARAFAPLATTLSLAKSFSTSDTMWLLPKGRSAAQELQELTGWNHTFHVEPSMTDPEAGIITGTLIHQKG